MEKLDMEYKKLSVREAIKFGFYTMAHNRKLIMGMVITNLGTVTCILLSTFFILYFMYPDFITTSWYPFIPYLMEISSFIDSLSKTEYPIAAIIAFLISYPLTLFLLLGNATVALDIYDHGTSNARVFFKSLRLLPIFIITHIFFAIAGGLGLICLIIPGIILLIRSSLYLCFIIDKHVGPFQALKRSWYVTSGYFWKFFLFFCIAIPIYYIPVSIGSIILPRIVAPIFFAYIFLLLMTILSFVLNFSMIYLYRKLVPAEEHIETDNTLFQ